LKKYHNGSQIHKNIGASIFSTFTVNGFSLSALEPELLAGANALQKHPLRVCEVLLLICNTPYVESDVS